MRARRFWPCFLVTGVKGEDSEVGADKYLILRSTKGLYIPRNFWIYYFWRISLLIKVGYRVVESMDRL